MQNCSMSEKDNIFVKESFFDNDHSEIGYDHSMENDYKGSVYQNILNDSLSKSENGIYIKIHERIVDNDYHYSTTMTSSLCV